MIARKAEQGPLSSPSRHLFTCTREETSKTLHQGELYRVHAYNLTCQVTQFTKRDHIIGSVSRLAEDLLSEMAQEMIRQKDEQEVIIERDQEARILNKIRRQEAAVLKDRV